MSSSSALSPTSRARQNFHPEVEAAISAHINVELWASYKYLAMSSFFDRDTVALYGFAKFYTQQSKEEREHACKLIDYMAKRGGIVKYLPIEAPAEYPNESTAALSILKESLQMEKLVNEKLLALHEQAEKHNDPQLEDFIEQGFLDEQVESIKQFADLITQLERAGSEGLGLYLFDQKLSETDPK